MSNKETLAKMVKIASNLTVDELKIEIKKFMNVQTDSAIYVFSSLLDALELKVSEEEYVEFCDSL